MAKKKPSKMRPSKIPDIPQIKIPEPSTISPIQTKTEQIDYSPKQKTGKIKTGEGLPKLTTSKEQHPKTNSHTALDVPKAKASHRNNLKNLPQIRPNKASVISTGRTEQQKQLATEYNKQRQRLKAAVKRAEQRGYIFTPFIPEKGTIVTREQVERLRAIKGDEFYSYGVYYDIRKGIYISGIERVKQERSERGKKAYETRIKNQQINDESIEQPDEETTDYLPPADEDDIIRSLEDMLSSWRPLDHWDESYSRLKTNDKNILENVLGGAIASLGRNQVARNIQSKAELVKELAWHICYGSSDFKWTDIQGDIAAITAIIYGRNLSVQESIAVQDIIDQVNSYETPQ